MKFTGNTVRKTSHHLCVIYMVEASEQFITMQERYFEVKIAV